MMGTEAEESRHLEEIGEVPSIVLCYAHSFIHRRNTSGNASRDSYGEKSKEGMHGNEQLEGKGFRNESKYVHDSRFSTIFASAHRLRPPLIKVCATP